ncbi:DUF4159 domain-containing protein [Litorimonas haliclonae]|uniref:DUF4159 domain-containing protein n=1 Tax=Litorimonas haliclonae TaxID=2081977 RepID=UPI0039F0E5CE
MSGLSFLAPFALLGLLALPLVWWILRIAPPKPKTQSFPPLRLFADIQTEEETPAKTPFWLLLFRLLMIALITFALAGPIFKKSAAETQRPLLLMIDNSWLSAPFWSEILNEAEAQVKKARRENVEVALVLTTGDEQSPAFQPAQSALETIETLKPQPWIDGVSSLIALLNDLNLNNKDGTFLSSGLTFSDESLPDDLLSPLTDLNVYVPVGISEVALPTFTREVPNGFESGWMRPVSGAVPVDLTVQAMSNDNAVLARSDLQFAPGDAEATARFELPAQLRNRVTHIQLSSSKSAGAVKLLDDSWGRPLIGVLSSSGDTASPLLSEPFYARTALEPYADIYDGDLDALLTVNPSVIVMPDSQRTSDERLAEYVEEGGVLIRFAGPKLAKRVDDLIPVDLRGGGRAIGGALSWETPQTLAPFETDSPFFGLEVSDEVTVSQQVMAQPGIETDTRSWARLEDGSPVVTAGPKGEGLIVLFHVTAGPEWSNLALSGLYVDMLRRILPLAKNRAQPTEETEGGNWIANRVLDGFGRFEAPDASVVTLSDSQFEKAKATKQTPPGFYTQGTRRRALQTLQDVKNVSVLSLPSGATRKQYGSTKLQSLAGIGLAIGLIGLALDALFALLMSGRRPSFLKRSPQVAGVIALCFVAGMSAPEALAQSGDAETSNQEISQKVSTAATGLHFAYVETGNGRLDRLTETGLLSLGKQLRVRTTIDVEGVDGVDPATDALTLYPFLYWVVSRDAQTPSDMAVTALNAYMESGGTIVFDTRDSADSAVTGNSAHPGLANLTQALDIPRLTPVPNDHVLTKAFYLLQSYPGRYANGQVWVDAASNAAGRDGVSPVIIGGHDWAAAWALDEENRPIIDLDDTLPRQREFAARFGVNLAMYTLAGNYKADQVHSAELVQRLGEERARDIGLEPADRDDENTSQGGIDD